MPARSAGVEGRRQCLLLCARGRHQAFSGKGRPRTLWKDRGHSSLPFSAALPSPAPPLLWCRAGMPAAGNSARRRAKVWGYIRGCMHSLHATINCTNGGWRGHGPIHALNSWHCAWPQPSAAVGSCTRHAHAPPSSSVLAAAWSAAGAHHTTHLQPKVCDGVPGVQVHSSLIVGLGCCHLVRVPACRQGRPTSVSVLGRGCRHDVQLWACYHRLCCPTVTRAVSRGVANAMYVAGSPAESQIATSPTWRCLPPKYIRTLHLRGHRQGSKGSRQKGEDHAWRQLQGGASVAMGHQSLFGEGCRKGGFY